MRRRVGILGLFWLLVGPRLALATPVDAERPAPATPGWSASIDGRAALSAGNVDRLDLGGAGQLQWQTLQPGTLPLLRARWVALADGALATLGNQRFVQRSFAHTRFTYMSRSRVGVDTFAQVQADAFTRLQLRVVVGAGTRVVAVARPRLQVWGGLGYMPEYERSDTIPGDPHPAETVNHRATSYASILLQPLEQGSLVLRSTTYAQPRLDDPTDVRLLQHVQLEAAAAPRLTIGFEVQVAHDTRPPWGVVPTDLSLRSVLRLRVG